MKKIKGIFIFLATFAIFGISTESFAKNHSVFSAQVNQPTYSTVEQYRSVYDALGGSSYQWRIKVNSLELEEARDAVEELRTQIANYRKLFGSGDQTWTGVPWTGTYNNPHTIRTHQ